MPSTALTRTLLTAILATAAVVTTAGAAPNLPDSPDGTVEAVAAAVADGHPEILWDAMPPTWREDLESLTRDFAATMDPAVYDGMFELSRRAIRVARAKKPLLMDSAMLESVGPGSEAVAEGYDRVLEMLEVVATSDVSTLQGLRGIDWRAFLHSTGSALLTKMEAAAEASEEPSPVATLRGLEAETVSRDGDTASVRVSVPGEDPETVPMTRVEGRWVPADLAADWSSRIGQARSSLASRDEAARAQMKTQMMMVLASANAVLDQVEAARTTEELEAVVGGLLGSLGGALRLGVGPQQPTSPGDRD